MSFSIDQSHVEQFSATVRLLSQQRTSRLRDTVMVDSVTGESFSRERISAGADLPNTVTTRHGDTPLNDVTHTRRWGYITTYDYADLLDKADQVRLLIDPTSSYTINHASTMGRRVDTTLIDALLGSATQGKSGGTSVALPSGQKILHGSTGLTVGKLITAKELLDAAEVDEMWPRYFAASARQMSNLLEDDKVASADYNTVRALVAGQLNEYMGFRFIRTERLTTASANIRQCIAWTQPAALLGIAEESSSVANQRPDKRNSWQLYTSMSIGAVRIEDEMVVEVQASEA